MKVAESADETIAPHSMEDESQCSVAIFENGVPESGSESDVIATDPSPVVTEALDFKNCFQTKSEIPAAPNGLPPSTPAEGEGHDAVSDIQPESSLDPNCVDPATPVPDSANSTGICLFIY